MVFDHCKDVRFQCSLTHGKKGNKPPVFKHQAGQIYNISNRTCPFVIAGIRLNDPGSSCHKRQEETQPTCQTARSTNTVLHLPNTLLASPKCSALACIFFFFSFLSLTSAPNCWSVRLKTTGTICQCSWEIANILLLSVIFLELFRFFSFAFIDYYVEKKITCDILTHWGK